MLLYLREGYELKNCYYEGRGSIIYTYIYIYINTPTFIWFPALVLLYTRSNCWKPTKYMPSVIREKLAAGHKWKEGEDNDDYDDEGSK